VPRHVVGQRVRRVVTPPSILLQRLHHDPVEIPPHEADECRGLDVAVAGHIGQLLPE
jgi:hypothetical protein